MKDQEYCEPQEDEEELLFPRDPRKMFYYAEPRLFDEKDGMEIVVFWYGVMLFGC